jgi:mono/diheme cytochrome c family protein
MPMTGPPYLSENEISKFERWIAGGLPKGSTSASTKPDQVKPILPMAGEQVTYTHVAPIFATRCAKCHAEKGLMGTAPEGYKLTSYDSTLSTNDRVRVVPGKPELSELIRRIRGHALPRMPFDGPPYLSENEIQLIETWIAQGARNVEGKVAPSPVGATVRLHGKLTTKWQLDDVNLNVDGQTRIHKSPKVGDYVEVRGYLDDALNLKVERLRRR